MLNDKGVYVCICNKYKLGQIGEREVCIIKDLFWMSAEQIKLA